MCAVPKMSASDRCGYKRWIVVVNNYSPEELAVWSAVPDAVYSVVGEEVGESGTPHLQGFVVFSKRLRRSAVSKAFPRAYLTPAKGSNVQASEYSKKDGKFVEVGVLPKDPGHAGGDAQAAKYASAFESAKVGDFESIPADLRVRHYQTWKKIKLDHQERLPAEDACTGVWIWGPSGTGKSTKARADYPDYYLKAANKWWDGYEGQDHVILEDLGLEHSVLGHHLKLWADKWDFVAECKGSSITARPKKFVITSQYSIEQVFSDGATRDALNRRCQVVYLSPEPVECVHTESSCCASTYTPPLISFHTDSSVFNKL